MATSLIKPIHRQATRIRATKTGRIEQQADYIPAASRPVVVSFLPGDIFQWRVKGTRTTYKAHLSTLMHIAQAVTIYQEYEAKMERYKERKRLNQRTSKPRKPANPLIAGMLRRLHYVVQ